jgi:hypothetical protein
MRWKLTAYAVLLRGIAISVLSLAVVCCAPPYVWGDEDRVENRLLKMVPLGSSPAQLDEIGRRRGWDINPHNSRMRVSPAGTETYMHDRDTDCRSYGGPRVLIIVARYYAPLHVSVESLWLFDPQKRLRDICVRKTVDAP